MLPRVRTLEMHPLTYIYTRGVLLLYHDSIQMDPILHIPRTLTHLTFTRTITREQDRPHRPAPDDAATGQVGPRGRGPPAVRALQVYRPWGSTI